MKANGFKRALLTFNGVIILVPTVLVALLFILSSIRVLSIEFAERIIGGFHYILHGGEPGNDMYTAEFIVMFIFCFVGILIVSNLFLLLVYGIHHLFKRVFKKNA